MILAALLPAACSGSAPTTSTAASVAVTPAAVLYWASREMHNEPRYQLVFEGGTDTAPIQEVRIIDSSSSLVVAAGSAEPTPSQVTTLCPPTRDRPAQPFGADRATLAVDKVLFDDFAFRRPQDFRIEVRASGGAWTEARIQNICHMTE